MKLDFLIPTKDRHVCLARTLTSVRRAAAACKAGILVCDQSAAAYPSDVAVTVLHRPDIRGLPAARNALLSQTRADIVCFLDDDVDVGGDLGAELLRLAQSETGMMGWGPVVETRASQIRRLHRLSQHGVFRDPRRLQARRNDRMTPFLYGCCFAIRRRQAHATGFDERRVGYALGEDLDFFRRLNLPLRFDSKLRVIHRRDGGGRSDARARGRKKGEFLVWLAHRHGRQNPVTPIHLVLAVVAAMSGRGDEPAAPISVMTAAARAWLRT
ncbi:MAG: glycosyltransferase [Planctomycetes bacterium]|nr:glycosyltransferase [Planctomycetota bacterium]